MDHQTWILPNFPGLTLLPHAGQLLSCQMYLVFTDIPSLLEHVPWFSQTDCKGQFFVGTNNIFVLQDRALTVYYLELLACHLSTLQPFPKPRLIFLYCSFSSYCRAPHSQQLLHKSSWPISVSVITNQRRKIKVPGTAHFSFLFIGLLSLCKAVQL